MKKFKKFLALLLVLTLVIPNITMFSAQAAGYFWDGSVAEGYEKGSGSEASPYQIVNGEQLAYMSRQVNSGAEKGKHYLLAANIYLEGLDWTPIGTQENPFSGTFDGNGYEILDLSVNKSLGGTIENRSALMRSMLTEEAETTSPSAIYAEAATYVPLADPELVRARTEEMLSYFPELADMLTEESYIPEQSSGTALSSEMVSIKQLPDLAELNETIDEYTAERDAELREKLNSAAAGRAGRFSARSAEPHGYAGLFGYFASGEIINVEVIDTQVNGVSYTGAIVGYAAAGTVIRNCYNRGTVYANDGYVGGIVGYTEGLAENCENYGQVYAGGSVIAAGGITGYDGGGIQYSYNAAEIVISASNRLGAAGGIAGVYKADILYCDNTGAINSESEQLAVGGIAGRGNAAIKYSRNSGDINQSYGAANVGGIAGYHTGSGAMQTIMRSLNSGNITHGGGFGGGIAGLAHNGMIAYCANSGNVFSSAAGAYSGGIAGAGSMINTCYNTGEITADYMAGGLCAVLYYSAMRTYNAGVINSKTYAGGLAGLLSSDAMFLTTNYWVSGTASRAAALSSARYPGTASLVSESQLKNPSWIYSNFNVFLIADENNVNERYPISPELDYSPIKGTMAENAKRFKYAGMFTQDYDVVGTAYYDDEYFMKDARTYDPSLATMSLCFELSTWSSYETDIWPEKSKNASELLIGEDGSQDSFSNGLGFIDFAQNDVWNEQPTKDSIGVVAARKKLTDRNDGNKDYTLIALGVRGGGYQSEWAGNFTLGETGSHEGFLGASDQVLDFLSDYIMDNDISGAVKLWIVGYSRGGATANMTAGRLTDGYALPNGASLAQKDLYCYTFEAPQGEQRDNFYGDYSNIHNVVNRNDLVPMVAPYVWGFARYGRDDIILPNAKEFDDFNVSIEIMKKYFDTLEGAGETDYKVQEYAVQKTFHFDRNAWLPKGEPLWEFRDARVSQNDVLNDTVNFLANNIVGSRSAYYVNWQESVRELSDSAYDGSGRIDVFKDSFVSYFSAATIAELCLPILRLDPNLNLEQRVQLAMPDIEDKVREAAAAAAVVSGLEISDDFVKTLIQIVKDLFTNIAADLWNGDTKTINLFIHFFEIVGNESLSQAHYPEVCLAWLMSQDPNYQYGNQKVSSPGVYRVMRVNCPVDVRVYNQRDELAAAILNNVPQDISGIFCTVNENDEKIFYLPANGSYRVEILATDDGMLSYSVNEQVSASNSVSRIFNCYDITISEGDMLTALLPAFSEAEYAASAESGSSVEYKLFGDGSLEISPSEDIRGIDAENANYAVLIESDNDSGFALGSGTYVRGSFAKAEAKPLSGSEFLGWHRDGALVSEEEIYRFAVTEDTEITAYFSPVEFHYLSLEAGKGGKISSMEGYYTKGMQMGIEAEAEEGYRFKNWVASGGTLLDPTAASTTLITPDADVIVKANFESENSSGEENPAADERCSIDYIVDSSWGNSYSGSIIITNISEEPINNWTIAFESEDTITHIWDAKILSNDGGLYKITNSGWNQDIQPGQTLTFGFTATFETAVHIPDEIRLLGEPEGISVEGYELDYQITSQWEGAYVMEMSVRNLSDKAIEDWQIAFSLGGAEITSLWNGTCNKIDGKYVIENESGFNAVIQPGAEIKIGMQVESENGIVYPEDVELVEIVPEA